MSRGSNPSKGWKKAYPRKGRERHLLKQQCGNKCFLLPKEEKFPVCKAHRSKRGKSRCEYDSRGVLAAYRRAKQWHYPKVAAKALRIARRNSYKWI